METKKAVSNSELDELSRKKDINAIVGLVGDDRLTEGQIDQLFIWAIQSGSLELVKLLRAKGAMSGGLHVVNDIALRNAVSRKDRELVRQIIEWAGGIDRFHIDLIISLMIGPL